MNAEKASQSHGIALRNRSRLLLPGGEADVDVADSGDIADLVSVVMVGMIEFLTIDGTRSPRILRNLTQVSWAPAFAVPGGSASVGDGVEHVEAAGSFRRKHCGDHAGSCCDGNEGED